MPVPELIPNTSPWEPALYNTNFNIIKAFLESDHYSPSQTALELTKLMENFPVSDDLSTNRLMSFLDNLWIAMMDIVKQIPHNHHWQHQLISLLHEITKIPRPSRSDLHTIENSKLGMGHFWDVLPVFNDSVFGAGWHKAPWDVPVKMADEANGRGPRSWSPTQWLNTNAFMAGCTGGRIPGADFPRAALQVLNHTLELSRTTEGLDVHIPAATVWVLYAGRWVYDNEEDDDRVRGVALGTTETTAFLYNGPEGYCRERWDFWKKRFREEMEDMEVKEETRMFAKRAFDEMVGFGAGRETIGGDGDAPRAL